MYCNITRKTSVWLSYNLLSVGNREKTFL